MRTLIHRGPITRATSK